MTKVHMSNTNLNTWVGDDYSQLLVEQVAIMIEKEESFYTCVDYLGELPAESNGLIDEGWRQKAAEWMFKVIDFYDLERDIVNVGMSYLDETFMLSSLHHRWSKQQCNIIAMASLKLAIKLLEPRTMNMEDMLKLGSKLGGSFSPLQVPKTVRYILQELTKYMTELAVCVYNFVKYKASAKSFAACLVAMESLDDDCLLSPEAKAVFLERIIHSFGLGQNDKKIRVLKKELKELLCHNTDLREFVSLIRASNNESESPKSSAIKQLNF